jgi:hypothetical protein
MTPSTTGSLAAPARRARRARSGARLILLIFGGLGLLLLAAGLLLAGRNAVIVLSEPTVTATITRIESYNVPVSRDDERQGDNGQRWRPIYEYHVGDHVYDIAGSNARTFNSDQVGTVASVRYNPQNPQDGVVDSFQSLWLAPSAFIVISVPLLLIAWAMRKPRQPSADLTSTEG